MGLLKSRKDAAKEFEKYVDAVEHPPGARRLQSRPRSWPTRTRSCPAASPRTSTRSRRSSRRATPSRRSAATPPVPTGPPIEPIDQLATEPLHRKRLGEVLVERDLLDAEPARVRRSRAAGRVGQAPRRVPRRHRHPRRARPRVARSPTSSTSKWSTCARAFPRRRRSPRSPRSRAREWLAIPLRKTDFGYDVVGRRPGRARPGRQAPRRAAPAGQALRRRASRTSAARSTSPTRRSRASASTSGSSRSGPRPARATQVEAAARPERRRERAGRPGREPAARRRP